MWRVFPALSLVSSDPAPPGLVGAETSSLPEGRCLPECTLVALISFLAVGSTLVLALLITDAQCTEVGIGVSPRDAALTEEFTWEKETWEVFSFQSLLRSTYYQLRDLFASFCQEDRSQYHHHYRHIPQPSVSTGPPTINNQTRSNVRTPPSHLLLLHCQSFDLGACSLCIKPHCPVTGTAMMWWLANEQRVRVASK